MRTKKWLAALMAAVMVIAMLPAAAVATDGSTDDSYTTVTNKEVVFDASAGQGFAASQYVNGAWQTNEALLSTNGSGETTFKDTAEELYESFGTAFNSPSAWEGNVVVSSEFYLDPAALEVGEGFSAIVDIMPTWRAYVANVKKTDDATIQVSFSNNTDNYYVVGTDGRATYSITEAGWYTFQWKLTDNNGQVACSLYINDSKVDTLSAKEDVTETSYVRKFYVQTYAPQSGTNKETCSGGEVLFRNTEKYVEHTVYNVSNAAQLLTALEAAQPGDSIQLAAGNYDVTTSGSNGQKGTGLVLDQNDITLQAADPSNKPVIYGFSTAPNAGVSGGINGQDTIYVSGQNVTLKDLVIMPLGGINANTNAWQKTVEVVAGASGFTMTGCETRPNTMGENSMAASSGSIHISTNDASVSGNSFGTGTTVCAGWSGSNGSVPTGFYTVNASGNTWADEDIASHTDGIIIIDNAVYVNHEVALQQAINDTALAGKNITLAADIILSKTITIDNTATIDGNGHTISGEGITNTNTIIGFLVNDGTATFNNLTLTKFDNNVNAPYGSVIKIDAGHDGAKVIANNVSISRFSRDAFTFKAGSFEINDCEIDCAPWDQRPNKLTKGFQIGFGTSKVTGEINNTLIYNTESNYDKWSTSAIEIYNDAEVVIDGCTIKNTKNGIHVDHYWAGSASYPTLDGDVTVTISNTDISAENKAVTLASADYAVDNAVVNITSGNYVGSLEIDNATERDTINVTGGTFSVNPKDYVAEGYAVHEVDTQFVVYKTVSEPMQPEADENGNAVITDQEMQDAIYSAVDSETPQVSINVESGSADSVSVTIPTADLGLLAAQDNATLTISTGVATVTFDQDALATLAEVDGQVVLNVAHATGLTAAQETVIGNNLAVELTLTDLEGNVVVDDFNGIATVSLPFTLAEGKSADDVIVYYVDDSGNLVACTTTYADGKVTFTTTHFSTYMVTYVSTGDTGDTGDSGNTGDAGNTGNTGDSGNAGNTDSNTNNTTNNGPKTGDESNLTLALIALLAACFGVAGIVIYNNKIKSVYHGKHSAH